MSEQGFTVRLGARIDGYLAAMDSAKRATKDLADTGHVNLQRLGGKMQDVGVSLSKSVTLPLIAVGGIAVKMSSDFEGAFGRMVGLAGVTADEVDGLKKSVLDLAGETGQAPQDLADGLYFLRSSGLDSAKAMDALKVSAQASAAGLGSTAVIADAVSSAMNAYAKSGLSAAEATDILVGTARAGKAEPAELAGALGRVLPIASELGITFEDVGGAIAALSLSGNDASTSATLLSNIMSKMLKPSQQGAEALAGVGMSADSIRESIADKGLLATLEDLKTRLGDAGFVKFLEDAQAVQGALALTGQNAEQVHATFDTVANSAGLTSEAFGAMAETSGFKMKQAWADIQVALIQAGDVIMPIISGIAGAIGHVAEIFSDLPGPVQTIVVAFLGLVAAAGPVLMVAGSLVKNFDLVKKSMSGMAAGASTASVALGAVGLVIIAATAIYSANAKKKAELTQATNDFVDALEREAAGQKDAVTQQIGAMLADKDLVANAQKYGLTISQLADVITGKTVPAYEKLKSSVDVGSFWNPFGSGESPAETAILSFTEKVDLMRKGLVEAHGQIDLTAQVERELAAGVSETDRETRRATTSLGEHTVAAEETAGATDALKVAQEEAKRVSDLVAQSFEDQRTRLEELYNFERSAVDSKYAYAESTRKAMEDVAALNTTLADGKSKQEDIDAATRTASSSILKASEDYATLNGASLNSEDGVRRQIAALSDQATTLAPGSPLRTFLEQYIADLARVQTDIQTRMTLNISMGQVTTKVGDIPIGLIRRGDDVVYSAAGRFVDRPMVSALGEGGRRELVLPLEDESRLTALLSDPRAAPVFTAMAGLTGGRGTSAPVTNHNNDIIVNNNGREFTRADMHRVLAMTRLAA